RLRRRNEDACNKFAWLDNGFVDEAILRRHVEVAHRYSSLASLRGQLHLRIHRKQRHSGGRGMHHRAGAVVHNGVVLILSGMRVTIVTGPVLLLAIEVARPEVPASRALHDISPKRRHIAHLWSRRMTGCIRQRRVTLLDIRMSSDLSQGRQRPEMQAIRADCNPVKGGDVADIDELWWRDDAILH